MTDAHPHRERDQQEQGNAVQPAHHGASACAHAEQRQALPRACSGMRDSSVASNLA